MKWLFPLVALLVGLLAGWFWGGSSDLVEGASGVQRSSSGVSAGASSAKVKSSSAGVPDLTTAEAAALESVGLSEDWLAELDDLGQLDQLSLLVDRIKEAKPADFGTLMDAIQKYSGMMRWTAQSLLATQWAIIDPQGMVAYIDEQPTDQQWSLRSAFYTAWAKEDPNAAYSSAIKLPSQRAQQAALQSIIQAVAADEPQRAIEMAAEMQSLGHRSDWLLRNIYQTWADKDLESARSSALALPDGPDKVQALSGAMNNWMQDDPLAALDWLESLPVNGTVYNSKKQVFRRLLNQDFDTAKTYIETKTDPIERREILQHMSFGNLAWQKDVDEIKEMYHWVGEMVTGQVYDRKVGDIMRALVQVNRAQAESFVMDLPAGNARMNAIGSLAQKMAEQDPVAALAFASGLAYEDEKQRALSNMSWQISRFGVDAVGPAVASSEDPEVQRQLGSRIVDEWSKYDQPGALAWAESLSDDQARGSAIQKVYSNWMQADPSGALSYLNSSVEQRKQVNFLRSGFQEWAREDPQTAVQWLDQIPDTVSDARAADIYSSVAHTFVQHDPMAASEWIAELEDGPARDRSVDTLVNSISKTDPEAGFIWATTMSDDKMRKTSLDRSVRNWVKTDPDAAFQAVKDAKIEAVDKESLLKMIEDAR